MREMSDEEVMRDVETQFEIDRFMRVQDFFKTVYPTLTERAKHLLRREYESHRSA